MMDEEGLPALFCHLLLLASTSHASLVAVSPSLAWTGLTSSSACMWPLAAAVAMVALLYHILEQTTDQRPLFLRSQSGQLLEVFEWKDKVSR